MRCSGFGPNGGPWTAAVRGPPNTDGEHFAARSKVVMKRENQRFA
jgi:hypothetical protein